MNVTNTASLAAALATSAATAAIQEWRDSAGSVLASMSAAGLLRVPANSMAAAVGATVFDVISTAAYNYIKTAPRVVNGETLPSEFADAVDV